jgi:putative redox protein
MIEAKSQYEPYRIWFTNGQHEAFADATTEKGGQNAGFRPHDLLQAALACCITMTARMFAEEHAIPLRQARAIVHLTREQDETIFEVKTEFDGDLTVEQLERLQAAIRACPVRKTLSRSIRFVEPSVRLTPGIFGNR